MCAFVYRDQTRFVCVCVCVAVALSHSISDGGQEWGGEIEDDEVDSQGGHRPPPQREGWRLESERDDERRCSLPELDSGDGTWGGVSLERLWGFVDPRVPRPVMACFGIIACARHLPRMRTTQGRRRGGRGARGIQATIQKRTPMSRRFGDCLFAHLMNVGTRRRAEDECVAEEATR